MKYEITITTEKNEDITLSLNTTEATAKVTSYGTEMDFEEFIQVADAIQELKTKFVVLTSNTDNNDNNQH